MSRQGWSTANFLGLAAGVVVATPLTMAVWCKTSVTGTQQTLIDLSQSSAIAGRNDFVLEVSAANQAMAQTGDAAANSNAVSSTTFAANTWMNVCGVWASATSRAAYLNGGGKGTEATSRVPASINQLTFGTIRQGTSTLPWAPAGTGDIAHAAIWKIDLSDADVLRLASGICPLAVRREFLVGYWPLDGGGANEFNVINPGQPMVLGGALTLSATPPKFFMPKLPSMFSI